METCDGSPNSEEAIERKKTQMKTLLWKVCSCNLRARGGESSGSSVYLFSLSLFFFLRARPCVSVSATQCFPCVRREVEGVVLFWWDQIDHPSVEKGGGESSTTAWCCRRPSPQKPNINKAGRLSF